jgi:Flp pilus assembly protein TadG
MVTAFAALMVTGLLAVTGLVVDGGLALTAEVKAMGQAEDAARAGAQAIDLGKLRATHALALDPVAAEQAADAYLASGQATGHASATTENVTVTVSASVHTTLLTLVGLSTLTVHADASAHALSSGAQ